MHWNEMDLSPTVTRFFKVMIGENFSKLLFLPPKFTKNVIDLVDQETKLEDSSGLLWPVTLSSVDKSLAFKRGWQDFSLNHNLQRGDFLVFNFIKGAHFVVQIFGINGCEKSNFDRNGPPSKRARMQRNISSQGLQCESADTIIMNRWSSRTVVSESNFGNFYIPSTSSPTKTPNSEGGNIKWSCLDNSFYMMIDRDTGQAQGEDRMCLYDLSSFELQEGRQAADIIKGIDVEEGTSYHASTSMRSQAEEKYPIGTEDLNVGMFTKETDIGMIENENDSEPKDDMSLECEKDLSAKVSNSLPLGLSCAELGKKGDNMSNVEVQLQNGERKTGDVKKIVKKGQPQIKEQARGYAKRLRGSGPSTIKESGDFQAAPHVSKSVKLESVDSLDMHSSILDAATCLALTDGQNYLELPSEFPAMIFRKSKQTMERNSVLLQDKERRKWPALYYERAGFCMLICEWDKFNRANGIQAGDQYVFKVGDVPQNMYTVDVLRKL